MRKEKTIVRQEVKWVPEDRKVLLEGEVPFRVWTVYTHTKEDSPPSLPSSPKHLDGFFLEDFTHDWTIRGGKEGKYLVYGSRVSGGGVWVLLEFVKPGECPWK